MASRNGNATVAPMPLSNVRREMPFFVMIVQRVRAAVVEEPDLVVGHDVVPVGRPALVAVPRRHLRDGLRPLLDLPLELLLLTHGAPVLDDARAKLAAAIG